MSIIQDEISPTAVNNCIKNNIINSNSVNKLLKKESP